MSNFLTYLKLIFLALLMGYGPTAFSQSRERKYSLLISNVSVIPIDRDTLIREVDLYVIGGSIERIEKHHKDSRVKSLSDVVIDGSGKFLIPSLIDGHVHYGTNKQLFSLYDSLYLAYGVTKVVALSGTDSLLEHRKAIKNQLVPGPDIYCSSPINNDSLMTAAQANCLLNEFKMKGYDFVKIYTELSKDGFNEFSEKADDFNLRLIGHIPRRVGTYAVLKSSMELVAHAEEFLYNPPINYLMGEIVDPMKPNELYINQVADAVYTHKKYVSPTLITFSSILQSAKDIKGYIESVPLPLNHPIAVYWDWSPTRSFIPKKFYKALTIDRLQVGYDYQLKLVKALAEKSVVLLAGTDAPTLPGLVPGYSLHQELQLLSKAGMSTYEVLKSATINPARFLNISDRFGTIEVGKEASFILLSKNPLINIKNTLAIEKIFVRGKIR